ncbi:MAG: hypothetical protein WED09_03895 [Homoserinimonas sp.]
MTSDQPGIDPRFDPIFQRGYDGTQAGAARVVTASSGTPRDAAEPPARTDDGIQEASRPVVTIEYPEPTSAPPSGLNPFIILLWVAGPGLTLSAGWLMYDTFASRMTGPVATEDQAMLQLIWSTAPSVVTVGLAIIAGLLFWHATGWRRAR